MSIRAIDRLRAIVGHRADEIVPSLINTYLNDTTAQLQNMRRQLEAGELALLGRSAHKLKSSSGIVAGAELAQLCHRIELAARDQDRATAADALGEAEREYGQVAAALEQECARMFRRAVSAGYQVG